MVSGYHIETMTAADVRTAVDWAAREGWNPGLHDAETFLSADSRGFFKGVLNGEIIATGSAINYDATFAFCGLYIVAPEHRGKGYGLELTNARLAHCGDRNVGIDGVLENVRLYERIGYEAFHENCRYHGRAAKAPTAPEVRKLAHCDLDAVKAFDRVCFPAPRDAFLEAWLTQAGSAAIGYFEGAELRGFAVRRPCLEGHKVGPLFAEDQDIAEALFGALQHDIDGELIILDTPGNNPEAAQIATKSGMQKVFTTARMYRKGQPKIADNKVFGITTFELG